MLIYHVLRSMGTAHYDLGLLWGLLEAEREGE